VIRRVLQFYPGQILSYPLLKQGERDLARTGLFAVEPDKKPTITVLEPLDPQSEVRDVEVHVTEQPTGSLMFGLGVNSSSGLVGSVVLNERNFDIFKPPLSLDDLLNGRAWRGGGQEFRAEAVPGTQLQRYTISFREPFLFDRPISFSASGYFYQRLYNEYTEERFGGRFTLGKQLNRFWSVTGTLRVEDVNVRDITFGAPPDYTNVAGDHLLVGGRLGVIRDDRDSFLRPTEGGRIEAAVEEVTGDFTFPIVTLEGSQYFTTYQRPDGSGRHVLMLHSQAAWAGSNAPVYERFFAGGFNSLRGFQFRGVGPNVDGFMVGGDFLWLNTIEYQVPVKANDQLYLVAFLDSGTVERDISIHNYRVSAGFGIRITVPMMGPVPIAVDFGFPIVRAPGDHTQLVAFYIGVFK
jgi:outer membrane protein assembly factor BamA